MKSEWKDTIWLVLMVVALIAAIAVTAGVLNSSMNLADDLQKQDRRVRGTEERMETAESEIRRLWAEFDELKAKSMPKPPKVIWYNDDGSTKAQDSSRYGVR